MHNFQHTVVRFLVATVVLSATANAQFDIPGFGSFGGDGGGTKAEFEAEFKATADGRAGELSVTAILGPGWHIYSTTQEPGGPLKTSFVLATEGIEVAGPARPDHPPEKKKTSDYGDPITEESFHDEVTWTIPVRIAEGINAKNLTIEGTVRGQVCKEGSCVPLSVLDPTFAAGYAGTIAAVSGIDTDAESAVPPTGGQNELASPAPARPPTSNYIPSIEGIMALAPTQLSPGPFNSRGVHATLEGLVSPASAKPGDTIQLSITIIPQPGWHVYEYKPLPPPTGSRPTIVGIETAWPISKPIADGFLVPSELDPEVMNYEDEATWTFDITIPSDAAPGSYPLRGIIGLQTCTNQSCDPPFAAAFMTNVTVGNTSSGARELAFAKSSYSTVTKLLKDAKDKPTLPGPPSPTPDPGAKIATAGPTASGDEFDLSRIDLVPVEKSIVSVLALAFLGGFILNFMPCVLPVIGLKVMSFVNQAGQSRQKTILLNVWYAAGMLAVFLVLATLTSAASLGWGQQFNYDGFTIPMLAIVFVMGLSFLGVWEIPIPGFASSGAAAELAEKEGYSGAFFKGVVTTILATPCSGPGLATALAYCANKPPSVVYLVFTCVGLGMAMPYLVIGVFPNLVRFIPKPGPWMDTFKQILGFVLLATVVYMSTLVSQPRVIPTIAFIFALWAACWWIGRVPISANFVSKGKAWIFAAAFSAVIGYFAYAPRTHNANELAWQDYSLATLKDHTDAQQTVLVDFTADW